MGAGPTNYSGGTAIGLDNAKDIRAKGLPTLYWGKLASINHQYHGKEEEEMGPSQERLESLGKLLHVVAGYWLQQL